METKNLVMALDSKINKDYKELEEKWLKLDKKEIINKSYEIATIQNFEDALNYFIEDYTENEEDKFYIDDEYVEFLINYNGNIFEILKDTWYGFRHPEDINFWYDYYAVVDEVIIEIIDYLFKERRIKL